MTKYGDLPQKFGHHVIVDTRSGATFLNQDENPIIALVEFISELEPAEIEALSNEAKSDLVTIEQGMMSAMMTGRPITNGGMFEVIEIGHFATIGGRLDSKNLNFALDRLEQIVGGAEITDLDREIVAYAQKRKVEGVARAEEMTQKGREQLERMRAERAAHEADCPDCKSAAREGSGQPTDPMEAIFKRLFGDAADVQVFRL